MKIDGFAISLNRGLRAGFWAGINNPGVYVSETGRSLFERAAEHLRDAKNHCHTSHIIKHWAIHHPEESKQPAFKFRVLRTHKSALNRQIHEAVRISTHGKLNSKAEFRQNQVKRLAVCLTAQELKSVEKELSKNDAATTKAINSLTAKLNDLKASSVISLSGSANDFSATPPLETQNFWIQ